MLPKRPDCAYTRPVLDDRESRQNRQNVFEIFLGDFTGDVLRWLSPLPREFWNSCLDTKRSDALASSHSKFVHFGRTRFPLEFYTVSR